MLQDVKKIRPSARLLGLCFLSLAVGACGRLRRQPAPAASAAPPVEAFEAPSWKNFKGAAFVPPPVASLPWRVMMLQDWPRPKKTPEWHSVKSEEAFNVEMPQGSNFRCLVNPVLFRVDVSEIPLEPEGWTVLRTVRCSSDGWHTYSQAVFSHFVGQDGKLGERSGKDAELYLHDFISGKGVDMTILLRPD